MPNNTYPLEKLNATGLFVFPRLFADLVLPEIASTKGTWRAVFVGPAWLRWLAPRGLKLFHFGGWWGKELAGDGTGINCFQHAAEMSRAFPMRIVEEISLIDGKPCLAVHYAKDALFPWCYVVDELRQMDEKVLLGMTIVDLPGLRTLPLPFLLYPQPRF